MCDPADLGAVSRVFTRCAADILIPLNSSKSFYLQFEPAPSTLLNPITLTVSDNPDCRRKLAASSMPSLSASGMLEAALFMCNGLPIIGNSSFVKERLD